MLAPKEHRNILVQYKGGGYDGCHWEWNYFVIDWNGEFHNIASSGYKGIDNLTDAIELLEQKPVPKVDGFYVPHVQRIGFYRYSLDSAIELTDYADSSNASHAIHVAVWLQDNMNIVIEAHCYECERLLPVTAMFENNWAGDGGISYSAKDLFCSDCQE
jgi:hypothetical protein